MIKIYGIKNCDTMKKAFKWLEAQGIAYEFHDYKKQGADADVVRAAIKVHGWETVINRRGTTWRNLPDDVKESMNAERAIEVAQQNPSLIKRPLLVKDDEIILGFKPEIYSAHL
ncbi:MAG: ArsC family reductase [Alphaproteobacteria bacterium]